MRKSRSTEDKLGQFENSKTFGIFKLCAHGSVTMNLMSALRVSTVCDTVQGAVEAQTRVSKTGHALNSRPLQINSSNAWRMCQLRNRAKERRRPTFFSTFISCRYRMFGVYFVIFEHFVTSRKVSIFPVFHWNRKALNCSPSWRTLFTATSCSSKF